MKPFDLTEALKPGARLVTRDGRPETDFRPYSGDDPFYTHQAVVSNLLFYFGDNGGLFEGGITEYDLFLADDNTGDPDAVTATSSATPAAALMGVGEPWRFYGPAKPTPDAPEGGDYCIRDADGNVIGEFFFRSSEGTTHDAHGNARLAASAPEMRNERDALRAAAMEMYDALMPDGHDNSCGVRMGAPCCCEGPRYRALLGKEDVQP